MCWGCVGDVQESQGEGGAQRERRVEEEARRGGGAQRRRRAEDEGRRNVGVGGLLGGCGCGCGVCTTVHSTI